MINTIFLAAIEKIDNVSPVITPEQVLQNGLNIAYFAIGIVAVVMIIVSGFTLFTSGGDAEAVKKAKNTIMYAVIGLVVVIIAYAITKFIIDTVGV
ncbi:MAG: hypothetical protein WCI79_01055 [Candidatus Saccharibacteria bacterium]